MISFDKTTLPTRRKAGSPAELVRVPAMSIGGGASKQSFRRSIAANLRSLARL